MKRERQDELTDMAQGEKRREMMHGLEAYPDG